jgi:hypothetical protein
VKGFPLMVAFYPIGCRFFCGGPMRGSAPSLKGAAWFMKPFGAWSLRPASEQELRNRRAWKVAHCVCMAPSLSRAIKSCERVDPYDTSKGDRDPWRALTS